MRFIGRSPFAFVWMMLAAWIAFGGSRGLDFDLSVGLVLFVMAAALPWIIRTTASHHISARKYGGPAVPLFGSGYRDGPSNRPRGLASDHSGAGLAGAGGNVDWRGLRLRPLVERS